MLIRLNSKKIYPDKKSHFLHPTKTPGNLDHSRLHIRRIMENMSENKDQ